jgi:quercetin dioxygenase-like cupin family protein
MEFEVAGRVHRLDDGEELLIPAGQPHSARNVGKTTVGSRPDQQQGWTTLPSR